uniref:Uncharacterized protein n=1 Tax=Romanomermis culicivorax TaxID=13658 RepID=A0A915IK10_ROMCU
MRPGRVQVASGPVPDASGVDDSPMQKKTLPCRALLPPWSSRSPWYAHRWGRPPWVASRLAHQSTVLGQKRLIEQTFINVPWKKKQVLKKSLET